MNLQNAINQIYEEPDYRDELRDDQAQALLSWAEGQIARLSSAAAADSQFDAMFESFRGLLKGMNRFAGRRGEMDAAARADKLNALRDLAANFGVSITDEQISQYLAALDQLDDAGVVTALTQLFTSAAADESAPETRSAPPSDAARAGFDSLFNLID